jgi:hypothetical protein
MSKEAKPWLGKHPIANEDHVPGLEILAAVHELKHGKHREEAEAAAHSDYKKQKAIESAAHHYVGMKMATLSKDDQCARKHSLSYAAAIGAIGADPTGKPPQEVLDLIEAGKVNAHKFSPHENDVLFPAAVEEDKTDESLKNHLDKLATLRQLLKG